MESLNFSKLILLITILFILVFSCDDNSLTDSEIIEISVSETTDLPANGTTIPIKAYIDSDAKSDKSSITFYCTGAVFKSNGEKQVTIDALLSEEYDNKIKKYALAELVSPTSPNEVIVFAQILSYRSDIEILTFIDAPVSSISIEPDKFGIPNDFTDEILFTCTLKAEKGVPSVNKKVLLEFYNVNTGEKFNDVRLRNASLSSNSNGQASTYFNGGNLNYTGTIKVVASVQDTQLNDSTFIDLYINTE